MADVKRFRELEAENAKLKRMYADLALEYAQGHRWNHKRVHRVYCALHLNLPRQTKRRVPQRLRQSLTAPPVLNQTWALDFMSDTLYDGRRFRILTIMNEGNREGPADVGPALTGCSRELGGQSPTLLNGLPWATSSSGQRRE